MAIDQLLETGYTDLSGVQLLKSNFMVQLRNKFPCRISFETIDTDTYFRFYSTIKFTKDTLDLKSNNSNKQSLVGKCIEITKLLL